MAELPGVKKDLSLPLKQVTPVAVIIMIVLLVLFFLIFYGLHGLKGFVDVRAIRLLTLAFLPVFALGVVLHELIHGVCFAIFGKVSFKAIRFGFDDKTLTPYAHCPVPLPARAYRLGLVMPAIMLGIVPGIVAFIGGNIYWLSFGAIFTAAAAGDFIVLWQIRTVKGEARVKDHPENAGCYVLDQAGNSFIICLITLCQCACICPRCRAPESFS